MKSTDVSLFNVEQEAKSTSTEKNGAARAKSTTENQNGNGKNENGVQQEEFVSPRNDVASSATTTGGGVDHQQQQELRANFAGTWGSNNSRLKKLRTEQKSQDKLKPSAEFWDFHYDPRSVFEKHCTRKKQVGSGERKWSKNLAFLDKVEYINSDSKTRLVGYYLPASSHQDRSTMELIENYD